MTNPVETMKAKVCLVGESGVGKSSLIRRFVFDDFSDAYMQTLGAKVVKRDVAVELGGRTMKVVLTVLDIMGEPTFLELLKETYFEGAQGILAVGDLTRPDTVRALPAWIDAARGVSGPVPLVVLGSKTDLPVAPEAVDAVQDVALSLRAPWWRTSSKTGENVEAAFGALVEDIAADALRVRQARAVSMRLTDRR